MTKSLVALTCVFLALRALSAEKPPSVAGVWEVSTRLPGNELAGRWTLQQKGATITGLAKGAHGDLPVSGSIAGSSFRATVTDGAKVFKVRAMVDGDTMDGSITRAGGDEYSWHAARATGAPQSAK